VRERKGGLGAGAPLESEVRGEGVGNVGAGATRWKTVPREREERIERAVGEDADRRAWPGLWPKKEKRGCGGARPKQAERRRGRGKERFFLFIFPKQFSNSFLK